MTDDPNNSQENSKDITTIINSHLRLYKTGLNITIYGGIGLILYSLGAFRRIKTIHDLTITDLLKRKKLRCMVKGITEKGDIMIYHTPFLLSLCFFPFTKYKNEFLTIKPLGIKYNENLIKQFNRIVRYKTTIFIDPLTMDLDNNIIIGTVHIPRSYLVNMFHIPIINSLIFTDFAKYLLSEGMCEFSLDSIPIYPNPYENFENNQSDEIIIKSLRLYKKYEKKARMEGKGIWSNNIQITEKENILKRIFHWFF